MPRVVQPWLAVLAVAAGGLSTSTAAGQASAALRVSVELLQPAAVGCTTALDPAGNRGVRCGHGAGAMLGAGGDEARMRAPDNAHAIGAGAFVVGEYSSRTVVAEGFEYVEMTLTW
ncbi:MAG: hypothetical protein JWP65_3750 [Ramlibacter sp.]|uniref:hypothetical protein n=1 Tax=Ramlibacter sp. TaxID=1917967 RepID=UPI0026398CB6|nr:hypothetical protein [Ramlibacter sp.]MDB5753329.1 hypothetical protein [Ramlibacter sp.]